MIEQSIKAEDVQVKSQQFISWLEAELFEYNIHVNYVVDVLGAEGFASFIDDVTKHYYGTDKGLGELIDTYGIL
ncbi:MAG: hypothetical protein HRU36_04085 [Rickettsiales bacterium]|nr:hypothetical protein [Rickettsiales bacterium]